MDVCTRAVHCVPTSTSLYGLLMRHSARFRRSRPQIEQLLRKSFRMVLLLSKPLT